MTEKGRDDRRYITAESLPSWKQVRGKLRGREKEEKHRKKILQSRKKRLHVEQTRGDTHPRPLFIGKCKAKLLCGVLLSELSSLGTKDAPIKEGGDQEGEI